MGRILVTGATGNVGRAALAALRERGEDAVAAVRPGSRADVAHPIITLDFHDAATWDGALAGVDRLLLVRPPAIADVGSTLNAFVDRGAGRLRHVVFLSVAGAEKNSFIPHAKVEAHLRESGVPYTFLRAGFFGQNLCGAYRQDIAQDDRLYVPAGTQPVSWVDTRDLGEAAAIALSEGRGIGESWTLTGAEVATFEEVAGALSRYLGRSIRYEQASILGYLWHLRRHQGLPMAQAVVQTVLHLAIRFGAELRVDPRLGRVLDRTPRTIEDTIRDNLHLWRR